jgi:hypothetical protein
MPNENDSDTPSTNPDREPPSQRPVTPSAPQEGQVSNKGDTSTNRQQSTTQELAREFRWVEFAQIGSNIILAIVGIFALHIYNGQLGVMRGQLGEIIKQYPELQKSAQAAHDAAEVNKEALYSVQRAFLIFPADPQVTVLNFPSGPLLQLEMPIENVGATQAHEMKDRVSCVTPMGPLSNNYSFPNIKGKWCGTPWAATGANVIPAKSKLLSQMVFVENKIVQEFVQQNSGPWAGRMGVPSHPTRTIVFYGWVTYRDIFKDSPERLSEFCRSLTIFDAKTGRAAWGYCPWHNCTDEDCPDYKDRLKESQTSQTYFTPASPSVRN